MAVQVNIDRWRNIKLTSFPHHTTMHPFVSDFNLTKAYLAGAWMFFKQRKLPMMSKHKNTLISLRNVPLQELLPEMVNLYHSFINVNMCFI